MYLGHVALGLGARRAAPGVALAALLIAPIVPDLGDVALHLVGLHGTLGYTHTVPAAVALAVAVTALGWALSGRRAGLVLGALAATHVPLDYVTSRLAVTTGGPVIGLGLYGTPWLDLAVESVVIVAGWAVYRAGLPADRRGRPAVLAMPAVMLAFQAVWAAMLA